MPRALCVGALVEVWSADESTGRSPVTSAWRRFGLVRDLWAREHDLTYDDKRAEFWSHMPWSLGCLGYVGHAERIGRPVADIANEWLARGGCTTDDIPTLRREAAALHERARRAKEN